MHSLFLHCLATAALLVTTEASAGSILPVASSPEALALRFQGQIQEGDAERFEANLEHAKAKGLIVKKVSLDSPGGSLRAGAAMARSIRQRALHTEVQSGAICSSACFMMFAAGKERQAEDGARIGVHSASEQSFGETESAKSATIDMVRFLSELGVPQPILGKVVTAKPSQMAWLTRDDLRLMQVNTSSERPQSKSYVETATPPIRRESLPPVANPADSDSASELLTQAQAQIRVNALQNALVLLKKAAELDPFDPLIASTYGYALHRAGRNQEAREVLLLAVQVKPDFAEAHRALGLTLSALGNAQAARDSFVAYYRKSSRTDLALSYLSDLAKNTQTDASKAARAALAQLDIKS